MENENSQNVKIVVFVPESHADAVREAAGKAGDWGASKHWRGWKFGSSAGRKN